MEGIERRKEKEPEPKGKGWNLVFRDKDDLGTGRRLFDSRERKKKCGRLPGLEAQGPYGQTMQESEAGILKNRWRKKRRETSTRIPGGGKDLTFNQGLKGNPRP